MKEERSRMSESDWGEFFKTEGYVAPIRALSSEEAQHFRNCLEQLENQHPDRKELLRHKSHLALTWADEIIRHPGILDAVEQVIGPNILCWGSSFFIKNAQDASFVSWHQDSTYWGLEPPDILTAWVALSDSVPENGAMRVIPRSHLVDQLPHRDTFAQQNLLSRGQEIAVEVDESQAVTLALQPGEISLHHVRLIHGSDPNPSPRRRIGFAIRYLPTYVRQVVGSEDSATLVRGVDSYHHFLPEQRPAADLHPDALACWEATRKRSMAVLMRPVAA
jgi:ectoine hydroxylase-related dioxygenase (phytanoyl-CoA dioxygenase family)